MKKHLYLGVSLTLLSTFAYAILTAIVKGVEGEVSLPMIVFAQSLVSLLLITPLLLRKGRTHAKQLVKTSFVGTHVLRTFFSLGISYSLFYAVTKIPLVDAVLLANTAPLMIPLLALVFFRQHINHRLWLPLGIGFIGVAIVLNPDGKIFNIAAIIALFAAVSMAMSMLLVRKASSKDAPLTVTFYYLLFSTLVSGIVALWFWQPLSAKVLGILALEGGLFFIVQFSLANALKYITPNVVGPMYYSNILFAAIISVLVWKTSISLSIVFGMLLTIVGGVLTIREQSRRQIAQQSKGGQHGKCHSTT